MSDTLYPPPSTASVGTKFDDTLEDVKVDVEGRLETYDKVNRDILQDKLGEMQQVRFHLAHMNGMTEINGNDFADGRN